MYIGTFGDTDPNFRIRQLQNAGSSIGSALQMVLGAADRKKREAEERRDREIQQFMQMAERYPDAAMTMGESLVSRYGDQMPHLRGIVDAIKGRESVRSKAESAGQEWINKVETREAPLRELVSNPASWQIPMVTPQVAEGRLRQIPSEVANDLPFDRRLAAKVWAQSQGYEFPEQPTSFDPLKHLTQGGKELYAQRTGLFDVPGALEAAEITAGLRPSAGAELSAEVRREEGARAEQRIELDREQQELAERRLALDQGKEARIAREQAEGTTENKKPEATAKEVAGWIVDDTELLAEEWDVGLKEAANATRDGKVTPDIRTAYAESAGPRPQPVLRSQANLIANSIAADLKAYGTNPTPAKVQEAATRTLEVYNQLVAPRELMPGGKAKHRDGTAVRVLAIEGEQALVLKDGKRYQIAAAELVPVPMTREEAIRFLLGN